MSTSCGYLQVLLLSCVTFAVCYHSLGAIVTVKVVKNPKKVGLGKRALYKCFGQTSSYSSKLVILQVKTDGADFKMESCSGKKPFQLTLYQ